MVKHIEHRFKTSHKQAKGAKKVLEGPNKKKRQRYKIQGKTLELTVQDQEDRRCKTKVQDK